MKPTKPTPQIMIKHEEKQSVYEFAAMLEKIAQKLKEEGKFTFVQGTEQVEISPSEQIKAEFEYVVKGDKHEFEIEVEWTTGEGAPKSMSIE